MAPFIAPRASLRLHRFPRTRSGTGTERFSTALSPSRLQPPALQQFLRNRDASCDLPSKHSFLPMMKQCSPTTWGHTARNRFVCKHPAWRRSIHIDLRTLIPRVPHDLTNQNCCGSSDDDRNSTIRHGLLHWDSPSPPAFRQPRLLEYVIDHSPCTSDELPRTEGDIASRPPQTRR